MTTSVAIHGNGVAACCCAHLLRDTDIALQLFKSERTSLPALLLSPATQLLLSDVFEDGNLFRSFPIIRKRIVLWGKNAERVELPHSGLVVPESVLLDCLWPRVRPLRQSDPEHKADWLVVCSRSSLPEEGEQHAFGRRIATAAPVALSAGADSEACWIESLEHGWLFLLPNAPNAATLLSIGGEPSALLGQSRLIAAQIGRLTGPGVQFPAYPRIQAPLCGPGWLACGSAAMGFDPICGEGAAHAVREGILAAAVLRALAAHARPTDLLAHYSARLLAGFERHLEICHDFYRSACCSAWWESELARLEEGIRWTSAQRSFSGPAQFRLTGFDLEPVAGRF